MNELVGPRPATNTRGPIFAGLVIAAVFLGGFLLWATLVPIASAVIAPGLVKVDSSRKTIQHLEGGVVSEILVRDGDAVEEGQVLIRLDKTRAGASLGVLRAGYNDAIAQQARLLAERDDRDKIEFPKELLDQIGDPKIEEVLQAQRSLFAARRDSLEGQLGIIDQHIAYLREEIVGLEAQKKSKLDQISSIQKELQDLTRLFEKGMIDRNRVLELQREKAELEGEHGEFTSQIAASHTSISEKQLEKFQLRKSFSEEVAVELRKVQADVFDFGERLLAARHTLDQTEIRAPVSGVIVGRGVHTIGGVIAPGEVVAELVPLNDSLIIEARVMPRDVDNVRQGLKAGVRISAFSQRTTPELSGRVTYVSADILENERTGETYFLSRVEVPEDELLRLGDNKILQPGMTAEVMIKTGERTVADYLLEPLLANFRKAWREN